MSIAAEALRLEALARSREPGDREQLLDALVELCASADPAELTGAPQIQALLQAVFMSLVAEAERDIRRRLAEKIAPVAWAPPGLVNVLALDEIEIAGPVIAESPVLKDHDLIRLLVESTLEHQIAVARRGSLTATVVEAILQQDEPAVLTALACNDTAEISPAGMARLVETSRRQAALRSPLARHPRLSSDLAQRLYMWVGQSLRAALVSRFRLDAAELDAALASAVREAHAAVDRTDTRLETDAEQLEQERRLISKLAEAGQLRPGYLLRALRERRLPLFVFALSHLGHFDADHIQRAIDSDRPELLALACAAVGIDRSVFPAILETVRELNNGRPGGGADGARKAANAFGPFAPDIAGAAFRQTAASI